MASRLIKPSVLAAVLEVCTGCSAPAVDSGSDKSFESSLSAVRESVSPERRAAFDQAVLTIAMEDVSPERIFAGALTPGSMSTEMKVQLSGKTADEILAEADRIAEDRRAQQRKATLKEIAALQQERDDALSTAAELEKFEVLRARFSKTRNVLGMAEPRILLRVRNGTQHALSRAYFTGSIVSPGRSIPWLTGNFNYQIPGGLEPGEEATWSLSPDAFSSWGSVEAPPDAGLNVTVVRLDGPDGKALFSTREFTAEDVARLESLLNALLHE